MDDRYRIDGHKLFWHLDRVCAWQKNRLIAPIYVEVSPTSQCNHRCVFCGIDFVRGKGHQLESGRFLTSLSGFARAGVKSIMFAGEGEPMLHPDIARFIKTAKQAGMDVSLTTNGSVGDERLWRELLPSLSWVRFSVDAGCASTHARVHGVGEQVFARVIEHIGLVVRLKKKCRARTTIGTQFVIIDDNLGDIPAALRLFASLKVDYFCLKPYSLHPQMLTAMDTRFTQATHKKIKAAVDAHAAKRTGMAVIYRAETMRAYISKVKGFFHCLALPFWGYLSSDGDFYTCSVFIGDKRFRSGNIYRDSVKRILFGRERADSIRFGELRLPIGTKCRLNCRMARINEFLEGLSHQPEHLNFI